VSQQHRSACLL